MVAHSIEHHRPASRGRGLVVANATERIETTLKVKRSLFIFTDARGREAIAQQAEVASSPAEAADLQEYCAAKYDDKSPC